jgi:inner membrane protein
MDLQNKLFGTEGKYSLVVKIALMGIMLLFLLYLLGMIENLVRERETRSVEAENNIVEMGGGEAILSGPVLNIPYIVWVKGEKNELVKTIHWGRFLPDEYFVSGKIKPEQHSRGIYQVTMYTAELAITGSFPAFDFSSWGIQEKDVLRRDAYLSIEFPDLRVLTGKINLNWDGHTTGFDVGPGSLKLFTAETRSSVGPFGNSESHRFSYEVRLRGGRSIRFLPFGNTTNISLSSSWQSPNFFGSFLPVKEDMNITKNGFSGSWHVLSLARNFPAHWQDFEINSDTILKSAFGVELMIPVDRYLKSSRSLKYSILFIAIPFLAFFLFEVFTKKKVHPLQYFLIGVAICVFYLLLLSFSEQIPFNAAYAVAALSTTCLIALYSAAVLKTWKKAFVIAGILIVLYVFLFVVLLSEDYALLIGSIGLFAVVASVMFVTRKIDWYGFGKNRHEPEETIPGTKRE